MKFVQLTNVNNYLFVLADDGSLWEFDPSERKWSQCNPVTKSETPPSQLVTELGVTERTKRILNRHNIHTTGQLIETGLDKLKEIPRLGDKSIHELQIALAEMQLKL